MNKQISGIEYTFNGETEGIEADDFRIAVRACESGKNSYTLNGKKYTAHGTIYNVETGAGGYHGGGRKPLPEEQKKKYITISVSGQPAEIERLKARAYEEHKTVSRFILDDIK